MEFRTKLVVSRKNKKAYLAYLGLIIALSSLILVFIPSLEDYIPWVFGTGIVVLIIGAVIAKGDVMGYGLSEEELVVSLGGIDIGTQHYPLAQISNMDFDVQAFAGRYMNDGAMIAGTSSDGMTNQLSFMAGGKKISCGFFLANQQHVFVLGNVFDAFYQRHIPFVEHNKSTRTYLFQILSETELAAFKRQYGYA